MSGRPETGPLITMAERAEAAGFDSVWIGDSITARPRHEPLTLMAALAARTRRVRLGTGVLLPALRNPVVLAHVIGTLDRVAEGRVILGVGIAADTPAIRKEFAATGVPWDRRVGRFLETLEICRALWRRDAVSFSGKHFTLDGATVEPKPHRAGGPPIWIGGSGPTAFREAARFDAWFPHRAQRGVLHRAFPRIQAAARAAAGPAGAVSGAAYLTLALDPDRRRRRGAHGSSSSRPTTPHPPASSRRVRPATPDRSRDAWMDPALDRRGRAASRAALRGRRSARPGRRSRLAAAAAAHAAELVTRLVADVSGAYLTRGPREPRGGRPLRTRRGWAPSGTGRTVMGGGKRVPGAPSSGTPRSRHARYFDSFGRVLSTSALDLSSAGGFVLHRWRSVPVRRRPFRATAGGSGGPRRPTV